MTTLTLTIDPNYSTIHSNKLVLGTSIVANLVTPVAVPP